MSHLSRDERLLAVDGALEAARAGHLAACGACRVEVEALRGVVARVRAVDVPEPSPLFWDHLAARVGEAIAQEPVPAPATSWWRMPRLAWAAAALVVAGGAGYLSTPRPVPPAAVVAQQEPRAGGAAGPSRTAAADEPGDRRDDGWGLIAALADESDDAAFAPQAGQSELSIFELSSEERAALVNELEAALVAGPGREG